MRAANWHCGPFDLDVTKPVIMGICNVTPDSFSDGGQHATATQAIAHAHALLEDGAEIIDVGGESTRPGANPVSPEAELARVIDVVRTLAAQGVKVSIDTRHASVAAACVEAGACIINDVSGFRTQQMRDVAADCNAGLVVMHMRGNPKNMQDAPAYENVVLEVEHELMRMTQRLLHEGVDASRVCLDAGIGFGKNVAHNLALVNATTQFADLGYALMTAVSRKSFIGAMSGENIPNMRDEASALCAAYMAGQGATVIRTHNAELTRDALANSRRAVIALGSNMGNSTAHIDDALTSLRLNPSVWLGAVSDYVLSEPAYKTDQAVFVNAIAVIQTTLSPHKLLMLLHQIENEQGRVREIENGPRSLDLDIIDYEDVVMDEPQLTLPHPKAHERDFVVTPTLSIMPGYKLANDVQLDAANATVGKICGLAHNIS